MTSNTHPIIAIATANGRGGIGVLRISSAAPLNTLMQTWFGKLLQPRRAHYLPFTDKHQQPIDRGIALYFAAPHSYTGEHVLELQAHGGTVVLQRLQARALELATSLNLPMRLAQPGEFTERAYLNGKLDLAQAEAVADLIEASTEAAARAAAASLSGAFSQAINALLADLIGLRTLVEATLDFPEEEIEFLQASRALEKLAQIKTRLNEVFAQSRQGSILREGLRVVLVGAPNVGKSSLLNALAGFERAIVTPIAGTTRDTLHEQIQIQGIALHIIDTAGLRESGDEVEQIGMARTWAEIEKADVILHLCSALDESGALDEGGALGVAKKTDAGRTSEIFSETTARGKKGTSAANLQAQAPTDLQHNIIAKAPAHAAQRTVVNKIDLLNVATLPAAAPHIDGQTIYLSAKHNQGIDLLRAELLNIAGWQGNSENVFFARSRHLAALQAAQAHVVQAAQHGALGDGALDLFAEELRLAQHQLSLITGEFSSDDLLGEIFGKFCIGK